MKTFPNIDCARSFRDGGIDAMAALNYAVGQALEGLDAEQQTAVKRAFGDIMGQVSEALIRPAVRAFPELDPDLETWRAVARTQARARTKDSDAG